VGRRGGEFEFTSFLNRSCSSDIKKNSIIRSTIEDDHQEYGCGVLYMATALQTLRRSVTA